MNDETKLRMRVLPCAHLVGVEIDAEGCFEIDLEEASRLENLGVAEICDEGDVFTLTGDDETDEQRIAMLAAEKAITALGKVLEGDDKLNLDVILGPVEGAPAADAPATDAPATDASATDAPAADAPAADASATDAPAADAPATEAPAADASVADEPKAANGKGFFNRKNKSK